MAALVVDDQGARLEPRRAVPAPAPGEALVRTTRALVTALDVEVARGLMGFRGVLGRQFVGIVERAETGPTAASDLVGRRVVGSTSIVCGSCDMCLAGLREHCRSLALLGLSGRDGCLAEWFTAPMANLVAIPDSLEDDQAVWADLLASAIQSARQLTIEGKPYITVLGDGPLGLLMVQVMARLNASVRLIGRHSENLARCEKWGIKHRHVDDIGRRADQDIVVDCTGTTGGLELAMRLVRPRGKIVLKTVRSPAQQLAPGVDLTPLVVHEIDLIGSRGGPVAEAVAMLARGEAQTLGLIGRRMKLSAGPAILEAAARPGALAVLVDLH
jgi:threonine dehydrogenase-like Zn-dependent dehydrogenase